MALDKCEHAQTEIRRRVQSNGVVAFWRQCLSCFQVVGTAVKHCEAPPNAAPFDEDARNAYWRERDRLYREEHERQEREREERNREWWEQYNRYLESPEWRRKRELVLARDDHRCQARLDGCTIYATQVHHKTYEHQFNEPLFDLVAICAACHERLHDDEEG